MTSTDVTAVLSEFGGAEKIDANGWTYGPFRIERGGGVAGHLQEYWITSPGNEEWERKGPYRSKRELRDGLRTAIVVAVKFACAWLDVARPDEGARK